MMCLDVHAGADDVVVVVSITAHVAWVQESIGT